MSKPSRTPEQMQAITRTDQSLLVSAAAGSGKTTVLADRVAYLVCDAPDRCEIDELLIVTYTNLAAEEMRQRIGKVLRERADGHDPRLQRQLYLLPGAQISTVHSLCSSLIRRHFDRLGIDPNVRTLDDGEGSLLRRETARKLLEARFDDPEKKSFRRLVDLYSDGDDTRLAQLLLKLSSHLSAILDPKQFLEQTRQALRDSTTGRLQDSPLGLLLLIDLRDRVKLHQLELDQLIETASREPDCQMYVDHLHDLDHLFTPLVKATASLDLTQIRLHIPEAFPKSPGPRNASAGQKRIGGLLKSWKEDAKKLAADPLLALPPERWQSDLANLLWAIDELVDLSQAYERAYADAKERLGSIDYSDLEHFALELLRNKDGSPKDIALELRRKFKYVLVDEYQDSNEVQDTLLRLLSMKEGEKGHPGNQFAVGDVKQSIYRFRQADVRRFLHRYDELKPCGVIHLRHNFRTRGPLIDVLNDIFAALMTKESAEIDYDESQQLVAGATFVDAAPNFTGQPVELLLIDRKSESSDDDLESPEREAVLIGERILQMMGKDGSPQMNVSDPKQESGFRPIKWSDFAILLRSAHVKAEQFAGILRDAQIPVKTSSTSGFFSALEIRDMTSLLAILDNHRQDIPLAAILRSPLTQLDHPEDAMVKIRIAYPSYPTPTPFYQAVQRYGAEQKDDLATSLRGILDKLHRWREQSRCRPVADLIWTIYQETNYLTWNAGLDDADQRVANLRELHEHARNFGSFQRQGLSRFMAYLGDLERDEDLGQASIPSESEDAVRILTVHKAKGLEFPVVFMPDLGKRHNKADTAGRVLFEPSLGIVVDAVDELRQVYYPSLATLAAKDRMNRAMVAEELRVLYVALTRAREHLILIGSVNLENIDAWDAWQFHKGSLPSGFVVGAGSFIDWIGPVMRIIQTKRPGSFELKTYTPDQIAEINERIAHRVKYEPTNPLALLKPPKIEPRRTPEVDAAIARVSQTYEHEPFTEIPGQATVTQLAKHGSVHATQPAEIARALRLPAGAAELAGLSPTDVGTATHLALQHLDFARPISQEDIAAQVAHMLNCHQLDESQARAVSIDAIVWMLESPLGELMRGHAHELLRELAITYAHAPPGVTSTDPRDRVMVRGRIDLVIPTADGLVLIDYKTDRISEVAVPGRAEYYRPQVEAYRTELEKITRKSVIGSHLIFLTPRVVHTF